MARVCFMYGCVKLRPKRIPMVSAIGGESSPVKHRTNARTNIIFETVGIDCEKSIRPDAVRASERTSSRGGSPVTETPVAAQAQQEPWNLFLTARILLGRNLRERILGQSDASGRR